jgi:hypothetical protein
MDATPTAYGAGIGRSIRNIGEVESKLYRDEEARQDNVAVMAAYNKMSDWTLKNLYHPDTGILNKNLGADTAPEVDKTLTDYDATVSKVRSGLDPRQQSAFDRMQREHYFQVKHQLYGYEAKQNREYADQQTSTLIQNQHDAAVQHARIGDLPGDESSAWAHRVEDNISISNAAIRDSAARNGLPAEAVQQQVQANTSAIHMQVMSELMANDQTQDAKAWYQEHASDLIGRDAIQAARMLKSGETKDESRAINDSILAEQRTEYEKPAVPDPAGILGVQERPEPTLADALARLEARNIKDTPTYDQTKERLRQHYTLEAAAKHQEQAELMQQADDQLRAPNSNFDISADVLGKLDPKNLKAALANQKNAREGGLIVSDESTKLMLRTMAAEPSQWDQFAQLIPQEYDSKLNKADRAAFLNEIAHVRGQVEKRDQRLSQGMVATQIASRIFQENSLTLPQGAPGTSDAPGGANYTAMAAKRNAFMDQLNRSVNADAVIKKRELNEEEIQAHANKLFAQVSWQAPATTFWDEFKAYGTPEGKAVVMRTAPAYLAPGAAKRAYRIQDIPIHIRTAMEKTFQDKGVKYDPSRIVEEYNIQVQERANAQP